MTLDPRLMTPKTSHMTVSKQRPKRGRQRGKGLGDVALKLGELALGKIAEPVFGFLGKKGADYLESKFSKKPKQEGGLFNPAGKQRGGKRGRPKKTMK